ncbi:MAG: adenosylmethionine--8-amino-7-oxononanoate transaminase [Arenimonas sp.]|nr:adenosylmethionine--8-amino-7-oxononanoate transaminase [Arenimonas sp.]
MSTFITPHDLQNWQQRDLSVLWHPCTQMSEHPDTLPLIPIKSAQGVWLEDIHGKRYLDAISSWWTNLFGHCEPRIAQAIAQQAQTLEHVIFAGFSHEPGLQLAEQLVKLSPAGLNRVFYADNGSAAIEVALKMSFQFFANQGQTKKQRFIALSNSYHGETLGALSMADVPLYRQVYSPLLLNPLFAPAPDHIERLQHETEIQCALRCAEKLEELVSLHQHELCALILEPLVQCAGGMRMYHPVYLEQARRICNQYGIHLIADEIAVGFGRTGSFFACEQANISPDFLCLSKGLTGGFLPMSAVLTTDEVFNCFLSSDRSRGFLHSHSYTGNPLGCAAALASLAIFNDEHIIERNGKTAAMIQQHMANLNLHPNVANLRQTGMIVAFDLVQTNHEPFPEAQRRGLKAYRAGLERGAVLRPLGDTLYWMPPYCIQDEELQFLADVTLNSIEKACA